MGGWMGSGGGRHVREGGSLLKGGAKRSFSFEMGSKSAGHTRLGERIQGGPMGAPLIVGEKKPHPGGQRG